MQLFMCPYLRTARVQKAARQIRRWRHSSISVFQYRNLMHREPGGPVQNHGKFCNCLALTDDCSQGCVPSGPLPQLPNPKAKSTLTNLMADVLEFKGFEKNLRAFA